MGGGRKGSKPRHSSVKSAARESTLILSAVRRRGPYEGAPFDGIAEDDEPKRANAFGPIVRQRRRSGGVYKDQM